MKLVRLKIFVSSVQKEFKQIRKQIRLDLKAFLLGDAFLHRFVSEVFLSSYGTIMGHMRHDVLAKNRDIMGTSQRIWIKNKYAKGAIGKPGICRINPVRISHA